MKPPSVHAIKLRAPGVDTDAQLEFALDRGIVFLGWPVELDSTTDSRTVRDALRGRYRTAAVNTVMRFVDAPSGDFVWTRAPRGTYRLARFTDTEYRYDASARATGLSANHQRSVEWADGACEDRDLPRAVIVPFTGRRPAFSSLSGVDAEDAARETLALWEVLNGRRPEPRSRTDEQALRALGFYDMEDLVYVWMQIAEDWIVVPSARAVNTPLYEYDMVSRDGRRRAKVQVKTGSETFDVALSRPNEPDTLLYYYADAMDLEDEQFRKITHQDLIGLTASHPAVLSSRIQRWFGIEPRAHP